MKFRVLLVALGLLALTSLSFGQGITVYLSDQGVVLTTTCGGQVPIPDGAPIRIYQDANLNGPDASDPQPVVGSENQGGTVNFNSFTMNGEANLGMAGTFYADLAFVSNGGVLYTDPAHSMFYVRVAYPDFTNPQVIWTSNVVQMSDVSPVEVDFHPWACADVVPNCIPSQNVFLAAVGPYPSQQNASACATLCRDFPVTVCVGPIPLPDQLPHIVILPGCSPTNTPCNTDCPPAGGFLQGLWVYDAAAQTYCTVVSLPVGAPEGCVCIHLDFVLPVNFQNVGAVAGDNSVTVNWTMANDQSSLTRYEIIRNDVKVADVSKTSSRDYTWVDSRAANGTTYNYKVVAISVSGSRSESEVVTATPNPMAAVITEYALHQNYPNPFNPNTQITFDVKNAGMVSLKVYNAMGQEVATLFNGNAESGTRHTVNFDASNLTSGLYFYTVKIGNEFSATKKMLLVK